MCGGEPLLQAQEYPALVSDAVVERDSGDAPRYLRVFSIDDGFLDAWLEEKCSIHWQSGDEFVRFGTAASPSRRDAPNHRHEDGTVSESPFVGDQADDVRMVLEYLEGERLP